MSVSIKTPDEQERMRAAGQAAAEVLLMIEEHVQPGVTTEELNQICHDYIVNKQGNVPAPLGYGGSGARPPVPEVDLYLGQQRRVPRHPGGQEAEARRHRQY